MCQLNKKIGENVRNFRKRAKLKQYELAEKIGVNCITMSKIEQGTSALKVSTLEKLGKVLGFSFEQMVFGEDAIVLNNAIIDKLRG